MKVLNYTVRVHRAEEGGYWAEVPALPGCFTQGETLDEVRTMAKEAIELFVESLIKVGKEVPVENNSDVIGTLDIQIKAPVGA